MTPAHQIAEKLTEAQRRAVTATYQDEKRHAPYHIFPNTAANRAAWRAMIDLGFVTSEDGGFDLVIRRGSLIAMVCLTPLALVVRDHLLSKDNEHGI
ncbi:hypothetical protein [Sphingobium sp.]|uniref:hypothetical protein n=1 Tax=Sphingobium sp. TaxID=1912891 RepID=UPI000DB589D1|nr:hypothetical protein [Sphingobium sp.]PZU65266.1 MAG: hypothetical protein DI540_18035 [Sphingobium sp.]